MEWYVTGDKHGNFKEIYEMLQKKPAESSAVIVLGDLGLNYYLDYKELVLKCSLSSTHNYIYGVRGNHEERPELLSDHEEIYDENVKGKIYYDPRCPYIRFFEDGEEYVIDGHPTLVIGGAYSVDKDYRLSRGFKWFETEQLDDEEQIIIQNKVKGKKYDLVMTHTCPMSWRPVDLFLSNIGYVDTSMEEWMEGLKDTFDYKIWLFGHYHDTRKINDKAFMLFNEIVPLDYYFNKNFDF